jgi:hypothetical protein
VNPIPSFVLAAAGLAQGYFLVDGLHIAFRLAGRVQERLKKAARHPALGATLAWLVFLSAFAGSMLVLLVVPGLLYSRAIAPQEITQASKTLLLRVWIIAFTLGFALRVIRERRRAKLRKRGSH